MKPSFSLLLHFVPFSRRQWRKKMRYSILFDKNKCKERLERERNTRIFIPTRTPTTRTPTTRTTTTRTTTRRALSLSLYLMMMFVMMRRRKREEREKKERNDENKISPNGLSLDFLKKQVKKNRKTTQFFRQSWDKSVKVWWKREKAEFWGCLILFDTIHIFQIIFSRRRIQLTSLQTLQKTRATYAFTSKQEAHLLAHETTTRLL